jgi:hypothetical protein
VVLQEQRHLADYDLVVRYSRTDTIDLEYHSHQSGCPSFPDVPPCLGARPQSMSVGSQPVASRTCAVYHNPITPRRGRQCCQSTTGPCDFVTGSTAVN